MASLPSRPASPASNSAAEGSRVMSDSGPSSVQAARDSPHAPQAEPAEGTTHSTPVVKGDKAEPRKCWICFADETDDGPTASEWRSPCVCGLAAHESCLLYWVADLQAPGRQAGPGGWVRCPQCNSRIIVAQPRNPIVSAANRLERAARILVYPGLGLFAAGCIYSGLAMHGLYSLEWVFGQDAAREILMRELSSTPRVGGSRVVDGLLRPMMRFLAPTALSWEPWNWTLRVDLPLVPVVLLLSRTRFADPILRVLPLFFFAFQAKDPNPLDLTRWPPSPAVAIAALPYLRGVYNDLYRRLFAEKLRRWTRELRPRGIGPGQAHNAFDREVAEELDGGELMMAINVAVNFDNGGDGANAPEPPGHPQARLPNNAPAPDAAGAAAGAAAGGAPPAHVQHGHVYVSNNDIAFTMMGGLMFPFISSMMGSLINKILPPAWTTSPAGPRGRPSGLLQTTWGRSIVGGCLFVFLKDAVFLYTRWQQAQLHRHRRIVDYEKRKKKQEAS